MTAGLMVTADWLVETRGMHLWGSPPPLHHLTSSGLDRPSTPRLVTSLIAGPILSPSETSWTCLNELYAWFGLLWLVGWLVVMNGRLATLDWQRNVELCDI